jgi:hypothetical protein
VTADPNDVTLLKRLLVKRLLESLQAPQMDDEGNPVPADPRTLTVALATIKAFANEIQDVVTLAEATAVSEKLARFMERPQGRA